VLDVEIDVAYIMLFACCIIGKFQNSLRIVYCFVNQKIDGVVSFIRIIKFFKFKLTKNNCVEIIIIQMIQISSFTLFIHVQILLKLEQLVVIVITYI
jgi:hypothetical protein